MHMRFHPQRNAKASDGGPRMFSPIITTADSHKKTRIVMQHKLISSPEFQDSPLDLSKNKGYEESYTGVLGEAVEFSPSQNTFSIATITRLKVNKKAITAPVIRIRSMCYYFSGGSSPKSRFYMFVPQSYGLILVEAHDIPSLAPRILFAACEYKKQYLIHGGLTSYWNLSSKIDAMKMEAIDPFTYQTSTIQLSGDFISPRYSHNICQISSNKVLLYGGIGKRKHSCGDAFLIDLDAHSVTRTSRPPLAVGCINSAIVDGVVYFFGGFDQTKHYNTLFYYNLATDQWGSQVLKGIYPRRSASLLAFGSSLLIVGGRNDLDIFADVWIVDPANFSVQKLNLIGDAYGGKSGCACIQVTSNSFLVVGGHSAALSMENAYLVALS